MTWLEFIALIFTVSCSTLAICAWAAAFTATRARNMEGIQRITELQVEAAKNSMQGQLEMIREEAIREASRRNSE